MKKEAYTKQIVLYLENNKNRAAYDLALEFLKEHPNEMLSHFLIAEFYLSFNKYNDAALEARKAFNLAKTQDDLLPCAILAAAAYYQIGEYKKGYQFLSELEKWWKKEEIEKLLFVFSVAMKDENQAAKHLESLYSVNQKAAESLLMKFIQ